MYICAVGMPVAMLPRKSAIRRWRDVALGGPNLIVDLRM